MNEIENSVSTDNPVYDLSGELVGTRFADGNMSRRLPKGIYISGGKKIVVR